MNVRATFKCFGINQTFGSPDGSAEVRLVPVYGTSDNPANAEWSKYTPQGEIKMLITSPSAIAAFELGKDYFVDFTPAD